MITKIDSEFVEQHSLDDTDIGKFAIVVAGCITIRSTYQAARDLLDFINEDDTPNQYDIRMD